MYVILQPGRGAPGGERTILIFYAGFENKQCLCWKT